MTESVLQILDLLITSPGNLAYYLALSFTVIAALQASINNFRRSGFPQGSRMVIGLSLLLLLQLIQFVVAGLVWLGLIDGSLWLPPVDRAVILVGLLVIVWLWLVPEPSSVADAAFGFLGFLSAAVIILSLLWWRGQELQVQYNATWPDMGSNWFGIIILGLGILGLLIRRPNSWGIGLAMLALLLAGQIIHFFFPQFDSDYSGILRLSQLMAYPWLMTLPQRFPIVPRSPVKDVKPIVVNRRRHTTDPQFVQEFVGLLDKNIEETLCQDITRLVSHLMLADVCLLVSYSATEDVLLAACGYNLIEERLIDGFTMDTLTAPMIVNALKRGKPLRLPSSSTSTDLKTVGSGMNISRVGHLLAVPIASSVKDLAMGIILISPFSNRGWGSEDQRVLMRYAHFLDHVVQRENPGRTEADWEELQQALQDARQSNQQLQDQLTSRQGAAAEAAAQLDTAPLKEPDSRSKDRKPEAVDEVDISPQAYADLQANLRFALEQVAELRSELAQASQQRHLRAPTASDSTEFDTVLQPLIDGENGQPSISPTDKKDITGIIQELHQPMASIMGYTDLLLGESIGILGAVQKKFLERIRVSTERMNRLSDELVQLTTFHEDEINLNPQRQSLIPIIEMAVRDVKGYLDNRKLNLVMDIPEELPAIQVDKSSIRRALSSLLRKAGDDSPEAGEVRLRAIVEADQNDPGFVMLQISDSGEGIPIEDLPNVFSRILSKDGSRTNKSRQKWMDLSTAKAVIEAHGGRIWVDSSIGEGSTYSTLLPIPND